MVSTDRGELVVTLPTDREIVMTRKFNAPARLVFEAFTNPELVARWWGFPTSVPVLFEAEVRPGGAWRYVMREPGSGEVGFHGEYIEVEPPSRLVYTEIYEGDFEGYPEGEPARTTVTFEEQDGVTTMVSTSLYQSKEVRDMVVESMEGGAAISLDRLEELIQTMQ
jgi:uncharacterized protein YndB with AHSA1/START domain